MVQGTEMHFFSPDRLNSSLSGLPLSPAVSSFRLSEEWLRRIGLAQSGMFIICLFNLPFSEALKEISLTTGFLLSILLVWGRGEGKRYLETFLRLFWPILLFAMVSLASGLNSINVFEGLRGFWGDWETLMCLVFFAVVLSRWKRTGKTRVWIGGGLLAGTLSGASVGLWRMLYEHRPFLGIMNLGDKNSTAQFLGLLIILLFYFHLDEQERVTEGDRLHGLFLYALPVLFLLLFLTRSRSFLVGVPLSFLIMIVLTKSWKTLLWVMGFIVLAGIAALLNPIMRWEVLSILRPTADGSFTSRYPTWEGAIRMWKAHPFLGVGPNNFHMANVHALYHLPEYASHGHNIFFNLLGEYGTLGVTVFFLWVLQWVRLIAAGIRTGDLQKSHGALTGGVLTILLVCGISHPMWGGSTSLMLMLAMALTISPLIRSSGMEEGGEREPTGNKIPVNADGERQLLRSLR